MGESMDSAKRGRVEAWLQYGDDLGLAPYFLARSGPAVSSSQPSDPPASSTDMAFPAKSAAKSVAAAAGSTPAAPSRMVGSSLPIISVAPGPTLFEAAERVVGETLEDIRADLGECKRCRLHKGRP